MKIISIVLFATMSFTVCFAEEGLDEVIKNIYTPNHKLINAMKVSLTALDKIIINKDEKNDLELMENLGKSTMCLSVFQSELMQAKYIKLAVLMQQKLMAAQEPMQRMQKSKELVEALKVRMEKMSKESPESFCLVGDEASFNESNSISKKYDELMKLKKSVHQDFARLINRALPKAELEKNGKRKMTDEEYQKGVLDFYYTYGQLLENNAEKSMQEFKKSCLISLEDFYVKNCRDLAKYNLIPFKETRSHYCLKDLAKSALETKDNQKCQMLKEI